jgi:4-hydroxy-tetrahydrodipicolinate reductase
MTSTPRIVHVGLGPLGLMVVRDFLALGRAEIAAAVDPAPALAGRLLSELVPGAPGVRVSASVEDALAGALAGGPLDGAVVTTSSDLAACAPTFRALLEAGLAVVSTCEELLFPDLRHRELARSLDAAARAHGGRLLGTGVNPGFVMDALPVFLSAPCRTVRRVEVWRIQDATTRRVPFQQKIGAGLELDAFARKVADGSLRHVGLGESLHFVARAMGWTLERWEETIAPVVADRRLECALGAIEPGRAAGVRQVGTGWCGGESVVRLEFQAAIGQADPHDRVRIEGEPVIDARIEGGIHGDVATSAIVVNALPSLLAAPPGLHDMSSIAMVHAAS